MTLDYSIIAFNALNSLVLMTIPIQHFDCFVNSFSRRVQFITSAILHLKNRRATKEINPQGIKITT